MGAQQSRSVGPEIVAFALVVIQHPDNDKFCLVHEKGKRGWWLPGGGVDAGQTFAEAAVREAAEEAGVDCILQGVLRVECTRPDRGRLRVIFFARPRDATRPLKSQPDHHSKGARWVTIPELESIEKGRSPGPDVPQDTCYLRGQEPADWFRYLACGGKIFPLSVLEMMRLGQVEEWPGPGDPPRACYPTVARLRFVCSRPGQIAVFASGEVPQFDAPVSYFFTDAACQLSSHFGVNAPSGLLKIRHRLDVREQDARKHNCAMELVYSVDCSGASELHGCTWVDVSSLKHLVVAHNNVDLRLALESWHNFGWAINIFDKSDVGAVLADLQAHPGALLLCTSQFPIGLVPVLSSVLVWSKSAVDTASEYERLVIEGAAYVAPDATTNEANVELLRAAAERCFANLTSSYSLCLLDHEGAPPSMKVTH